MDVSTVKMYTFVVEVAGHRFVGEIPATSFEEVNVLVPTATEVGELIETQEAGQICSICAGDMVVTEPIPQPIDDDWPETFI